MARTLQNLRTIVCAYVVFSIGFIGICVAQSAYSPLADTPSQRWLPPVKSYPEQPDEQAKLLSQLRGLMLNSDESNARTSPRLSDSEVQSLKDAMKQFDGNLPDGLSSDSLDAIPSDLISKALSNPDLMRKAKELAEQFSKGKQPDSNKNANSSKSNEGIPGLNSKPNNSSKSKQNDSPEPNRYSKSDKNLNSGNKQTQPAVPKDRPESNAPSSSEDFADLMEKLRSTQQQFEKDQTQQAEPAPSAERPGSVRPSENLNKAPLKPRPPTDNPKQGNREESATPGSTASPPASSGSPATSPSPKDRSVAPPNSAIDKSNPFDSKRSSPTTQRKNDDRIVPPNPPPERTKPGLSGPASPGTRSAPKDVNRDPQGTLGANSASDTKSSDTTKNSDALSNMNMRKELDRKGFGPTLQKLIEDAQRASQAARVPPASDSSAANKENKQSDSRNQERGNTDSKSTDPKSTLKSTDLKRPEQTATKQSPQNLPRPAETPPRPPQPDSAFSKGLKQTGKALNDFWSQISKSESAAASKSAPPKVSPHAASAPPSTNDLSSLSNPFNARVLQGLLVLAVVCVIGFFALRYMDRTEQIRREIQEAKIATKIDEIRTRDDIVRAFHAMTKQRFQSAQTWWTNRHVAEKFENSLPEYTTPIRTLSGIYEQARYFPQDHQLSADQIEDAKLALKQCRG